MSEFERKYGKYAIKNLSLILIICYAVGYLLSLSPTLMGYLYLNPQLIIDNFQIWRLFTWILVPANNSDVFLSLILLYFFYSISNTVEQSWGSYRYNIYIFSGLFFTIVSAFVLYFINRISGNPFFGTSVGGFYFDYGSLFSTFYITMSIFLALAVTYPEANVMLMFIIPIKLKYMGIIYIVYLFYRFITYLRYGLWAASVVMIASLLNFIIFYLMQRNKLHMLGFSSSNRGYQFKKMSPKPNMPKNNTGTSARSKITRHKCAVCGQTDESAPNLSFRFCSKCNGNYEYCENHLFTHRHVE